MIDTVRGRLGDLPGLVRRAVWDDLGRPAVAAPSGGPGPGSLGPGRRGPGRWGPGRWGPRTLWALAVLVLFSGTLDLVQHYDFKYAPSLALSLARAAPLAVALGRPRTAWWTELAAVTATAALTRPHSAAEPWPWAVTSLLSLAPVFIAVGLRTSRRATVAMWLEVTAVGAVLFALVPTGHGWLGLLPMGVLLAVGALTADALRGRSEARTRLAAAEQLGEAEQARATLLAERARIARELHDVVAHHMSLITVQADSAPYRIPDVPAAAAEEFASIAAEARRSLTEMRRLLHVLRSEDAPDGENAPQPGLSDLPALVRATRQAGVDARLVLAEGLPDDAELPALVRLSVYRIVQEALSNVVRHAPGADARVTVDRVTTDRVTMDGGDGAVRIEVVDSGATGAAPPLEPRAGGQGGGYGGGHGLVGMRERVAMLDGELDARPLPGGGFRLSAVLPLRGLRQNGLQEGGLRESGAP